MYFMVNDLNLIDKEKKVMYFREQQVKSNNDVLY